MLLGLLPLLLMLLLVPTTSAPTITPAASSSLFEAGETGRFVGIDVARANLPPEEASSEAPPTLVPIATEEATEETWTSGSERIDGPVAGAPSIGLLGIGSETPATPEAPSPELPAGALTGSEFLRRTAALSRADREEAIHDAIAAGHTPAFLWRPCAVELSFRDRQGRDHRATLQVLPDYLAIGTDQDFVRMPMSPRTAQRLADRFGCHLPTKRVVDAVWRAAAVKLQPRPLPPTSQMMSNEWYGRANELIERERAGRPLGALTAGDKKDIVLTNRLRNQPGRVAIYGWHGLDGRPIQPLSTVHEASYADYSHGARLVKRTVEVDGRSMTFDELLASTELAGLVSDEGPVTIARYPL